MSLGTRRMRVIIGLACLGQAKAQIGLAFGRTSSFFHQRLACLGKTKAHESGPPSDKQVIKQTCPWARNACGQHRAALSWQSQGAKQKCPWTRV